MRYNHELTSSKSVCTCVITRGVIAVLCIRDNSKVFTKESPFQQCIKNVIKFFDKLECQHVEENVQNIIFLEDCHEQAGKEHITNQHAEE